MAYTLRELRGLTDEQLVEEHDNLAGLTRVGINYFLDELRRREQEKQTRLMLSYTHRMLWLTVFIAILTITNVIAVVAPLVCR